MNKFQLYTQLDYETLPLTIIKQVLGLILLLLLLYEILTIGRCLMGDLTSNKESSKSKRS